MVSLNFCLQWKESEGSELKNKTLKNIVPKPLEWVSRSEFAFCLPPMKLYLKSRMSMLFCSFQNYDFSSLFVIYDKGVHKVTMFTQFMTHISHVIHSCRDGISTSVLLLIIDMYFRGFQFVLPIFISCILAEERNIEKALLVKKHLKRLKKVEGAIKLVGGRGEYEGNVEILHEGRWGAICDDEWDSAEAKVICNQLGYKNGTSKYTGNAYFGPAKRKFWMDNIYCEGSEKEITSCRFDGWGSNDCDVTEAAGVICDEPPVEEEKKQENLIKKETQMKKLPDSLNLRIVGGRIEQEGRVEVKTDYDNWEPICGDGWSILEAMVVCKTLNYGYANNAFQTDYFGGNLSNHSYANIKCRGNEISFSHCLYDVNSVGMCPGKDLAAVSCTSSLPDLVIDHVDIMRTAHLEDRQLFFLQCAMEENCLASEAYRIQRENPNGWHLETRRLLRFTARIFNAGTADFRPFIPKHLWEWHMCHMHYHSMEIFATFDIFNNKGIKVAEGHKASFCLEDNQCLPGIEPSYNCNNFGDQGISVNCSDIYKYTVDCQWIDISDIKPGVYTMKVVVNPEFKVAEMSYENNAALCTFYYSETYGTVTNCTVQRP